MSLYQRPSYQPPARRWIPSAPAASGGTTALLPAGLTLSGQTINLNVALPLAASALTLTPQNINASAALPLNNATLALAAQPANLNVSLPLNNAALALAGQFITLTESGANTLILNDASLILAGQVANLNVTVPLNNATLTLSGQAAAASVPQPDEKIGGDDVPRGQKHRGWDEKRSLLKRRQDKALEDDIRLLYRKLSAQPAVSRRAKEALKAIAPAGDVTDTERLRLLATLAEQKDQDAIQIEIALRMLADELLQLEEQEDMRIVAMLLARIL